MKKTYHLGLLLSELYFKTTSYLTSISDCWKFADFQKKRSKFSKINPATRYMGKKVNCNKDDSVIEGLRSNDSIQLSLATQCLFYRLRPLIRKHVLNNGGNKQDAEDIIVITIEELIRGIVEFKFDGENLSGLAINIAKWRWIDFKRRHGGRVDNDGPVDPPVNHDDELKNLVADCFDRLTISCQEILRSKFIERWPEERIADELGISVPTLRKRIANCKGNLKDCIKKDQ